VGTSVRDSREEGIALIAVLWTLTLLAIIAGALSLEIRSSTRIARNMAEKAAVRAAADAGIQRAILDLMALNWKFRADGSPYTWRFAKCTVHLSVQYEAGKVNLNQASDALLAALFGFVGVDPGKAQALSDAIADFRDTDDLPRAQGAEKAEYRAAGLAWGPKNAPFDTVEELQQVLGITADVYAKVVPYLTVYSTGGAVNSAVAAAPLAAILRQASLDSQRIAQGFVYSIRSEAEGTTGAVFVREAVVQVLLGSPRPFQILDWRQLSQTRQ
jgi:general secretion pathway protein K